MAKHAPRFLKLAEDARQHVHEIIAADVLTRLTGSAAPRIIDVREDHEWAKGHLPGATHLGRGILERDIEKLVPDPHTELILYCGGGYRSALAAESLQRMGYDNVWSMAGGFTGWRDAGHPVE
ncbi:MAG TPA: rhodanese-like domain-containing protein [Pirellulales bacterium]|jgi:rhodanese-related sulfurtransferase|nr:rhodanese-like domain-containing protein [Pirellulales bacterium]